MATTAKPIVPESTGSGQKGRKPMTKAHKRRLVSALDQWRASLTPEQKEELRMVNKLKQKARWDNMSDRERKERLAGVRKWQAEQRAAKRAAEKAAKAAAKDAPKAGAKKAPGKGSRRTERGESAARALGRKAAAK
jgi:hypothetical protein